MKTQKLTVNFKDLDLTITKTQEEWIDELTNYMLELAYHDGEFANGLLDDLLRGGFKGYWTMSEQELIEEIVTQLESIYDTVEVS
jgi:hypothetical protein